MKKKIFVLLSVGLLLIAGGLYAEHTYSLQKKIIQKKENSPNFDDIHDGDIIFQDSQSSQCVAIQQATKSRYSHCGIIFREKGSYYVFEAIQPVTATPLDKWIQRGKNKHYVIKRLNEAEKVLTPAVMKEMRTIGEKFYGKNYDLTFGWSDDRIYCSELVWKIYKRAAGIEIGELQRLKDFDLTGDIVKKKLKERYGDNIPLDEIVISPVSIYNSALLKTVKSN